MDWLGVVSLWAGALVFAIKSVGASAPPWAPDWLSSGVWNYVPLILVTVAIIIFIRSALSLRRGREPTIAHQPPAPASEAEILRHQRLREKEANRAAREALRPPEEPQLNAQRGMAQPGGTPDTKLTRAFEYLTQASIWAKQHKPSGPESLRELVDKLYLRELSAWGRVLEDAPVQQIPWQQWISVRLNLGTGNAHAPDGSIQFYDIQFDYDHLRRVWPSARV